MASDQLDNFIKVEVSTGYAAGATAIVLTGGEGAELPDPASGNYNLVWWDSTNYPDPADDPNVEIVRVTALATDTLTVTRAQEGTADSAKNTGGATYKMHLAATEKAIVDVDDDERINQASHGLTAGQAVYHNGTIYALADASAAATAEFVGFVDDVSSDGDYFTLRTGGRITGLSGLTAGEAHFLSETAGAITATAPTAEGSVIKPVLIADSTTSGFIYNMRGTEVSSTMSFFQAFGNGDLSSGELIVNHNLGHIYCTIQVYNNNDKLVMPDDITLTDANNATIDLTSFGTISSTPGQWHVVVLDTGTTTAFNTPTFTTTFTNASLVGGVFTAEHNMTDQYPLMQVLDENDQIVVPDSITATDTNNADVDLTSYGTISGTWTFVASSIGGTDAATPTSTSYVSSMTSGSVGYPVVSFPHNLGSSTVVCQVYDNNGDLVQPDDITATTANNIDVDVTSYGTISGTWTIIIIAPGAFPSAVATGLSLSGQAAEDTIFYDGANWVAQGGTEKISITSFTVDQTTTTPLSYTGCGFKPSAVDFYACENSTVKVSMGHSTAGVDHCVHNQPAATWERDFANAIRVEDGSGIFEGQLTSFDADGFTISWAAGSGSPTGTLQVTARCYR